MTDFSRLGALQVVTYTLKVVVSKKSLADLRFLEGVTLGTRASEAIERSDRASIDGVWAYGRIEIT